MNDRQLKDKIRNIAKKKNVDFNTVFRLYMYDRFIERLAISKYKDNFIIKGGFYLSVLFGVENRATMDIDAAITNASFDVGNIKNMLEEIISIDINDNAILKLTSISSIRDIDEYGGYRVTIHIKIENIKEVIQIDIATGDPIIPGAINYKYLPILEDEVIYLWTYNIETVLAEKLETILSRAEANSRTRDYYDVYMICEMYLESINIIDLKEAVRKTFEKRKYNGNIIKTLKVIEKSEILLNRWQSYSTKYNFAKDVVYMDVIQSLQTLIRIIDL
ncbi:MAG: nucleotidyl transferase AbiEii/AbiGii toxin family protein [Erysipelotrichaceae bacterium]|nr:nucleotidyl transferase AbiEii/AbiGii toxin family protein [Erysipelotrichaceae bacterium]MDD4642037.1 nucleotidyl transferase AbiEii/AbiGii toxin family protein [Erysipelotrichaceae bacterium]